MKVGDLIQIANRPGGLGVRGFNSFPGEYGFHSAIYLKEGSFGILLEQRDDYCRLIIGPAEIWLEKSKLKVYDQQTPYR